MKNLPHLHFPGIKFSLSRKAMAWPVAAALIFVASVTGQLAPSHDAKSAPVSLPEPQRVMTDLPRFGENAAPVADLKPREEVATETLHLAPFVVMGDKRIKLRPIELLTKKAFAAENFKRYDYSAFSLFQHREDVRLNDMTTFKNYADNLMLAGDVEGSRAITRESSRLFLRPHDPESEYIDAMFNSRIR